MNPRCMYVCMLSLLLALAVLSAPALAAKEPPQATGWASDVATNTPTKAPAKVDAKAEATAKTTAQTEAKAEAEAEARRHRIRPRDRKRLGLTIGNIGRVMEDLQAEGVLDTDDVSGTALQVLDRLLEEDPDTLITAACEGDRDWGAFFEALLAFLERMLPIVIRIFGFMS